MTAKKGFSRRTFLKGTGAALPERRSRQRPLKTQDLCAERRSRAGSGRPGGNCASALEEILPKFEEETGLKVVLEGTRPAVSTCRRA